MNKKKIFLIVFIILILALLLLSIYKYYSKNNETKETNAQIIQESEITQTNENEQYNIQEKEDININMTAIGDIMCHNTQYNDAYNSNTGQYDFSYVFEDIKQYINSADIAIGNLETTFAGKEKGYSSYPRFNTPEQLASNLKDLGLDVVSTANNHCLDTSYTGLVSTIRYLDEAEIDHIGTSDTPEKQNEILIKDVNGVKIAFLAFTYGTNGIPIPKDKPFCVNVIDEKLILEQIRLAKEEEPDLICVNMHWGNEYQSIQNPEQGNLTNLLINNGVDIILGSHPHVLQPMKKITVKQEDGTTKDCFVIYSLGNFMSGQTKEKTRNSVILNIEITKDGKTGKTLINEVKYIPIYMYKAITEKTQRYKVLDIEKTINDYESGKNTSIGQATYLTLKKELERIKVTIGENIKF